MNPTELYLVTVVVTYPVAIFRPTDPKGKVNALNVEIRRGAKMATIIGDQEKISLNLKHAVLILGSQTASSCL